MPIRDRLCLVALALLVLVACTKRADISAVATGEQSRLWPRHSGEVWRLPGLHARVEVARDRYGIPHIYARDLHDLALAHGYMVARDRFWQMDAFRRLALGRLSTLVGAMPIVVSIDEQFRAINLTARGTLVYDEIYAAMRAESREVLDAFARGVNLYLDHVAVGRYGAAFPPEYNELALGLLFHPLPGDIPRWQPRDSIAIGRFQQWNLSGNYERELRLGQLMERLGSTHPEWLPLLIRFAPAVSTPSMQGWLAGTSGSAPVPTVGGRPLKEGGLLPALAHWQVMREFVPIVAWSDQGSNNWVIGPSRSATGRVILANDPHLLVTNPPLFYQVHMNTKEFGGGQGWNASGVVFPGIPVFMIAHTESIAWGVTVLGYDVTDVWRETPVDGGAAVLRGNTRVPVRYSQQLYCHGYSENCIERPIAYVDGHGPRLPGEGDFLTFRWTGMEPTQDFEAFVRLMEVRSVPEAMEAVEPFQVGAQNFVFGDTQGNIGYKGNANIPLRDPRCPQPPWVPMDGASGLCEWIGYLENRYIPQVVNPPSGYIATANNDIVGTTFDNDPTNDQARDGTPVYYWTLRDIGFRMARLQQLLEAKPQLDKDDMERIAADTHSLEGELVTPYLVAAGQARPDLVRGGMREALDRLARWRFGTPTGEYDVFRHRAPTPEEIDDSIAASIYYTWVRMLKPRFTQDELELAGLDSPAETDGYELLGTIRQALYALQSTAPSPLWDDVRTSQVETKEEVMLAALADAIAWLAERFGTEDQSTWRWGRLHFVRFTDPYGFLGSNLRSLGPWPNDGSLGTLDAASYLFLWGSYVQVGGPVMRMVTDLDPSGVKSWNALPGGQVHDRHSKHYDDLVPYWMANTTYSVPFSKADIEANLESLTILMPE